MMEDRRWKMAKTATLWAGGPISINLSFFPFGGSFCCYECEIDAKNESET
jgi:hypothetical protein